MTTLATLVQNTTDLLYGLEQVERPTEDVLNGAITSGDAALTATNDALWKFGDVAEFQPDGELVIFAADASGSTAVRRGQRGTTAANQADGDTMLKNPLFPISEVEKHVQGLIRSELWPHVWTWHHDTVTAVATDTMYDLDQYIDDVVRVYQENIAGEENFHPLPNGWWDTERQINTAVATNTTMLRLRKVFDYDETVYYTAKRRPHVDDLANLADEIADMIPWGAAARALASRYPQVMNDAARSRREESGLIRSYQGLKTEFLSQRDAYHRLLFMEVQPEPKFRKRFRRRW